MITNLQCNIKGEGLTLKSTTSSRKEDKKLLDAGLIFIQSRIAGRSGQVTGWRVCIDYAKDEAKQLVKKPFSRYHSWDQGLRCKCLCYRCIKGKGIEKHFRPIHYSSKTMTEAETEVQTTTEKENLALVLN
ncbi:hypothetical protein Tco_0638186 [Tanacetum coccineum]